MGRASRRKALQRKVEQEARGNCYDAAVELIIEMHAKLEGYPFAQASIRLAHGTVTGQGPIAGVRMGHAWVEYGDTVFDMSNGANIAATKEQYLRLAEASNVQRYDYRSMLINLNRHGHYGPWHEEEGVYGGIETAQGA